MMREVLLISSFSQMRKQMHKEGKCFAKVTQRVSDGVQIQTNQWSFILTIMSMILHRGCALESSGELLFILHLEQVKFLLLNYASIKLENIKSILHPGRYGPFS